MLEKELLKGFPIFSNIPQEDLSEIAQWGKVLEFDLNATIFQDDENALDLYGVVDGEVDLSLMVRDELLRTDIQYEESIRTHIETIEKELKFTLLVTCQHIFLQKSNLEHERFSQ